MKILFIFFKVYFVRERLDCGQGKERLRVVYWSSLGKM